MVELRRAGAELRGAAEFFDAPVLADEAERKLALLMRRIRPAHADDKAVFRGAQPADVAGVRHEARLRVGEYEADAVRLPRVKVEGPECAAGVPRVGDVPAALPVRGKIVRVNKLAELDVLHQRLTLRPLRLLRLRGGGGAGGEEA